MRIFKALPLAFALTVGVAQVVPVGQSRLPNGCTNGQTATYNTTTRVWDCTTASSGSATSTSAYASPPGSPISGDLWFPNDSFYALRYSGSAMVPWGPIFPMTAPVSGDFSWVNQGTATITTTYGGVHLYKPGGVGSHSLALRVKTAPATPYTITAAFIPRMEAFQYLYAGLAFRQSSDGKIATFAMYMDTAVNTGAYLIAKKFTNETTDSGANYILRPALNPNSLVWLQMSNDGANRILRWSTDGQNWEVLHTVGRTDYLTADQVGFFVNANSVTYGAAMTLLSWKQS